MILSQVILSILAFIAFKLLPNGAIGTKILQILFYSGLDLVNIRNIDKAVVIESTLIPGVFLDWVWFFLSHL